MREDDEAVEVWEGRTDNQPGAEGSGEKNGGGGRGKKGKRVSHAGLHVTSWRAMLTFQLSAFH